MDTPNLVPWPADLVQWKLKSKLWERPAVWKRETGIEAFLPFAELEYPYFHVFGHQPFLTVFLITLEFTLQSCAAILIGSGAPSKEHPGQCLE